MKNFLWRRQGKNWFRLLAPLLIVAMQFNGLSAASALGEKDVSEFLRTDAEGNPARWNPCAPLKWKLVGTGLSDTTRESIFSAMKALTEATGLMFTYEEGGALSDMTSSVENTLVVGLTAKAMDKRVAGTTRVKYRRTQSRSLRIASATVALNSNIFRPRAHSFGFLTPTLLHELGHSVGLAHVSDATDIMFPKLINRTRYQQSDLVKLARVGASNGCIS